MSELMTSDGGDENTGDVGEARPAAAVARPRSRQAAHRRVIREVPYSHEMLVALEHGWGRYR